jgi:hypothetical protein
MGFVVNSNCKWSEDKREEFEGKTAALKWRKPTYESACHLDIGESPPHGTAAQPARSLTSSIKPACDPHMVQLQVLFLNLGGFVHYSRCYFVLPLEKDPESDEVAHQTLMRGEFTNVNQLFRQRFDACVHKSLVNKFSTSRLSGNCHTKIVNAEYLGSQILLCAYPSQRRIGAGFRCRTG